jgi:hypothetical protein
MLDKEKNILRDLSGDSLPRNFPLQLETLFVSHPAKPDDP